MNKDGQTYQLLLEKINNSLLFTELSQEDLINLKEQYRNASEDDLQTAINSIENAEMGLQVKEKALDQTYEEISEKLAEAKIEISRGKMKNNKTAESRDKGNDENIINNLLKQINK